MWSMAEARGTPGIPGCHASCDMSLVAEGRALQGALGEWRSGPRLINTWSTYKPSSLSMTTEARLDRQRHETATGWARKELVSVASIGRASENRQGKGAVGVQWPETRRSAMAQTQGSTERRVRPKAWVGAQPVLVRLLKDQCYPNVRTNARASVTVVTG